MISSFRLLFYYCMKKVMHTFLTLIMLRGVVAQRFCSCQPPKYEEVKMMDNSTWIKYEEIKVIDRVKEERIHKGNTDKKAELQRKFLRRVTKC